MAELRVEEPDRNDGGNDDDSEYDDGDDKDYREEREDINRKKNVFFRALPELPNPPPMTPIWAIWSFFFRHQNSRFESHLRYTLYLSFFYKGKIFGELEKFTPKNANFLR